MSMPVHTMSMLTQLEAEAAAGWPKPWWPQDAAACQPWDRFSRELLDRYIGLLADAHTEARKNSNDCHLRIAEAAA